jgi:hypothetical protein
MPAPGQKGWAPARSIECVSAEGARVRGRNSGPVDDQKTCPLEQKSKAAKKEMLQFAFYSL